MMFEDPLDIFDTSLSTLLSIPPIAFSTSSPDAFYTFTPPLTSSLRPVKLQLPEPPPSLYIALQANNLWLAAIYLADLICLGHIDVGHARLVELGAGAGLPGIVACQRGAQVVSSDWGVDEILSVIRGNLDRACKDESGDGEWAVVGHQWGTDVTPLINAFNEDHKHNQRFDIVLLADTLWLSEAHSALLDSIIALLKPGGIAHITAGLHTGRGPLDRFCTSAKTRGLTITQVREVRWRHDGGWDDYHPPKESLEEERGVVVYFTLRTPE